MATKRGERVDYKSLHNLTSVDLTSTTKKRKRNLVHQAKIYAIERLTSKRETCEPSSSTDLSPIYLDWISAGKLAWALVIKDSSLTKKLRGYTVVNMADDAASPEAVLRGFFFTYRLKMAARRPRNQGFSSKFRRTFCNPWEILFNGFELLVKRGRVLEVDTDEST